MIVVFKEKLKIFLKIQKKIRTLKKSIEPLKKDKKSKKKTNQQVKEIFNTREQKEKQ